ncbi:lytic transglycosylase domain-containing protein [Aureibaculum sp. 2210JD6-5]|uniref:lytic transglycosylase domain-containing protein n=1 Tax=Aureibaculum sp. 2210JD6-5 TaxID=3103957 RepID=UPI002AAD5106|nr:lytic transglycosylase domain-containing protein [Aureibaculum sp. 2210JD6-5]MDY7396098.1 lytic transglycosylase domain-containing protein [Aureibaculum sp. 2210JD6-5]
MNKPLRILVILSIIILSGVLINAVQQNNGESHKSEPSPVAEIENHKVTSASYSIKAIKLPENLEFAGERVPLEKPHIWEDVDREFLVNTYWQSNGLLWIKRAHKYFPIIEPILKEKGLPDDFKYIAVIESNLMNVTSPAGAKGFWQQLSGAARENGLEVNSNVDERYHLEKTTRAACDYLLDAKKTFGTWALAAAAYHSGKGNISKYLREQMVDSYYDLLSGENTERYLPRILAAKYILSDPEKYGFQFEESDLYTYPEYTTVKVDTPIANIAQFAKDNNTTYRELKILNPWLRENHLNNKSRKVYFIDIPK